MTGMGHGRLDELDHKIRELRGFLGGILFDGKANVAEIKALHVWMQKHAHLMGQHPFAEYAPYLRMLVENPNAPQKELVEDLLWLQEKLGKVQLRQPNRYADLKELQGVIQGITADGKLDAAELRNLALWIEERQLAFQDDVYDDIRLALDEVAHGNPLSEREVAFVMGFLKMVLNLSDDLG